MNAKHMRTNSGASRAARPMTSEMPSATMRAKAHPRQLHPLNLSNNAVNALLPAAAELAIIRTAASFFQERCGFC